MEEAINEYLNNFEDNNYDPEKLLGMVALLEKNPSLKNKILDLVYESKVFLRCEEFKDYYLENKDLINELFDKYEIDDLIRETFEFSMLNNEVYMFPKEVITLFYDKLSKGDSLIKNSPLLKIINSCNMIYYDDIFLAMFLIIYKII